LRDVLRQMRVAAGLPERSGVNETGGPFHESAESPLRTLVSELAKQFRIGIHPAL
jgi:hypothetical protein